MVSIVLMNCSPVVAVESFDPLHVGNLSHPDGSSPIHSHNGALDEDHEVIQVARNWDC